MWLDKPLFISKFNTLHCNSEKKLVKINLGQFSWPSELNKVDSHHRDKCVCRACPYVLFISNRNFIWGTLEFICEVSWSAMSQNQYMFLFLYMTISQNLVSVFLPSREVTKANILSNVRNKFFAVNCFCKCCGWSIEFNKWIQVTLLLVMGNVSR